MSCSYFWTWVNQEPRKSREKLKINQQETDITYHLGFFIPIQTQSTYIRSLPIQNVYNLFVNNNNNNNPPPPIMH